MMNYGLALARAKANKADWNEETYTAKATITWADADYEYELEVENENADSAFEAWVEGNAEALARADAKENGTTFEELLGITYDEETFDDDARFEAGYEEACERERDWLAGC